MKKLIVVITIILSLCIVPFSVSAENNNIDFFDFDDYSKYTADSSTGLINADILLPTIWRYAYVKDGDGFSEWHNTFNFTTTESHTPVIIDYNPFARVSSLGTIQHTTVSTGHFLDLQFIPFGAQLNITLVTQLMSRNILTNFADIFVAFVDSTGKVISHATVPTTLDVYQMGRDGVQYTVEGVYTFNSVPDNAKGFYYVIRTSTGLSADSVIPVVTVSSSLVFKYSELAFNVKQNQIMRDKVSNIEQQLGDLINRPLDPGVPPGQSDFDDLHNNEQELLDQSQNYLDNGLSFFQNASGVILGLGNGFEAIKVLVQPVFALPFANSLITVSISLGLVATLIGVFISAVSNGGSEKESAKSGKKSAQGGKSAPKGGKK